MFIKKKKSYNQAAWINGKLCFLGMDHFKVIYIKKLLNTLLFSISENSPKEASYVFIYSEVMNWLTRAVFPTPASPKRTTLYFGTPGSSSPVTESVLTLVQQEPSHGLALLCLQKKNYFHLFLTQKNSNRFQFLTYRNTNKQRNYCIK